MQSGVAVRENVLFRVSTSVIKCYTNNNLGRNSHVILHPWGNLRQELKTGTEAEPTEAWLLWPAPYRFLSLLSYTALAYLHSGATSHSELDPPAPVINDPSELCIDNLMEAFFSLRFLSLDNSSLHQVEKPKTIKTNKDRRRPPPSFLWQLAICDIP